MGRVTGIHRERLERFLDRVEAQVYPEPVSPLHTEITACAFQRLSELFPLSRGCRVLDVGCGEGPALRLFEEKGVTAVGITLGDQDLAACREKGFTAVRMDQSFLEFGDGVFDILWARHVIEHSIFPFYTLHEFRRVMKGGGMMYLEVPLPGTDCHHERNPNHYSVLTRSAWLSLMGRAGFDVIETVSYRFIVPAGNDEYAGFYCRRIS